MTGNQLIASGNRILIDDLYGLIVDDADLLSNINDAAASLMADCAIRTRDVPLTFTAGVNVYPLAMLSVPLVYVIDVKKNRVALPKQYSVNNYGWTADTFNLYLYDPEAITGTAFTVDGHLGAPPILADNTQIAGIPARVQKVIPVRAVLDSLGAFQTTAEQALKIQSMERQVFNVVREYQQLSSRNSFPKF